MYYAEKIIDGVLHFKTTPNGKWKEFSKQSLTDRITILEGKLKENNIEY